MSVGNMARRFLTACAQEKHTAFLNHGDVSYLFRNVEKEDWDQFYGHVTKHGKMPSLDLLEEWWDEVPKASDPATYYLDLMRERYFTGLLSDAVDDANDLVQEDKAEEAAALVVSKLMPALLRGQGNRLIDISDAYGLVLADYLHKWKEGDDYGVKIGYPVVDDYGGLIPGDLMSVVGRPAAGKSFLMLRAAHRAWLQGHAPVFLSMEMNNLISAQRLIAMDIGVPLNALKLQKGQGLSTPQLKKLKAATKKAKKDSQPFHLMDGNLSTTVEDLYSFCRQMNPTFVVVDGAYMLKHPNPRLGRFERVAENCELLKQEIAGSLGIPVICSWQFSREAAKKMKSTGDNKVGLEDIGYSDAIGQISSIVLGLMDEENVQTMHRKRVTIMKGRNGETGVFDIHWQFNPTLCFDHWVEPEVSELQVK